MRADQRREMMYLAGACATSPPVLEYMQLQMKHIDKVMKDGGRDIRFRLESLYMSKEHAAAALRGSSFHVRDAVMLTSLFGENCGDILLGWLRVYLQTGGRPRFVRQEALDQEVLKLRAATGLSDAGLLELLTEDGALCSENIRLSVLLDAVAMPPVGPALYSRVVLRNQRAARKARSAVNAKHLPLVGELVPGLSAAEKESLWKRHRWRADEADAGRQAVPFDSGAAIWQVDTQNLFNRLARRRGNAILTGPSISTTIALRAHCLFDGFDVDLSLMACVAWMCMRMDHSIVEILVAGIPLGCGYRMDVDANEFLISILDEKDPSWRERLGREIRGGKGVKNSVKEIKRR
jgi:hypothetical protein